MPVMETLMLAKAGYEVGKGVFNWLDAKNKKFKSFLKKMKKKTLKRKCK